MRRNRKREREREREREHGTEMVGFIKYESFLDDRNESCCEKVKDINNITELRGREFKKGMAEPGIILRKRNKEIEERWRK